VVERARSDVSLPHGTVTFLFTDIEGSTRLLEKLGDEYADVLAEHRRSCADRRATSAGDLGSLQHEVRAEAEEEP
jgi:class 3 adenylate cyclase